MSFNNYSYREFVNNIIPYINKTLKGVGYDTPYTPISKPKHFPFCTYSISVIPIKEFRKGKEVWGVSISFKCKERYIPDNWVCSSYEQRKRKRIHSIYRMSQGYDDYSYNESMTLFGNYKWVYSIKYFVKPYLIQNDKSYMLSDKEFKQFKKRVG